MVQKLTDPSAYVTEVMSPWPESSHPQNKGFFRYWPALRTLVQAWI